MDSSVLNRRPVVLVFSILAALQVVSAGLGLTDVISKDVVALFVLVVAAVQAGMTLYVQSMVAPWDTVVSQLTHDGTVIAGPASDGVPGPPPATPGGPPVI